MLDELVAFAILAQPIDGRRVNLVDLRTHHAGPDRKPE